MNEGNMRIIYSKEKQHFQKKLNDYVRKYGNKFKIIKGPDLVITTYEKDVNVIETYHWYATAIIMKGPEVLSSVESIDND